MGVQDPLFPLGPCQKGERNDVALDPQALKRFRQQSIGASVKLADGFTSY
jgi:hypothetical protein